MRKNFYFDNFFTPSGAPSSSQKNSQAQGNINGMNMKDSGQQIRKKIQNCFLSDNDLKVMKNQLLIKEKSE